MIKTVTTLVNRVEPFFVLKGHASLANIKNILKAKIKQARSVLSLSAAFL